MSERDDEVYEAFLAEHPQFRGAPRERVEETMVYAFFAVRYYTSALVDDCAEDVRRHRLVVALWLFGLVLILSQDRKEVKRMENNAFGELTHESPILIKRVTGGWLAVTPTSCPLRIGVTGPTETIVHQRFRLACKRWRDTLTEDRGD